MRVFIENEAGSRRKNIYDERTLAHLRTVEVSAAYPFPYGFVLGTISGDGDAVDCFVLTETPLPSGTIVECQPVGLLEQIEDGEIDHKVLAVPPGTDARTRRVDAGGSEDFHCRRVRACAGQTHGDRPPARPAGRRSLFAKMPRRSPPDMTNFALVGAGIDQSTMR